MILKELYIKNLATISEIRFNLSPNLNLITGETGAGKSILVDALKILSGEKVDYDLIRFGENNLIVEGVFEELTGDVKYFLKEKGLEREDNFLIIRREIYKEKPQRIYINDNIANLKNLEFIGSLIISIFGQEEEKSFFDENVYLRLLDLYSKIETKEISYLFNLIKEEEKKLQNLIEKNKDIDEMREFYSFSIQEIEKANLKESEEEELKSLKFQLKKKEEILKSLNFFLNIIEGDEKSIIRDLKEAEKSIMPLTENLEIFKELINHIKTAREELEEAYFISSKEASHFQEKTYSLDEVESRLALIENLKKKYGKTIKEILEYKKKAKKELENIVNLNEKVKEVEKELIEKRKKYDDLAKSLNELRVKNSKIFQEKINKLFPKLNLKNAKFEIEIIYNENMFSPYGKNEVIFKVQTNLGEAMLPIGKIASGGELSRIHLAIQEVIEARKGKVLVFDEVDQGIGGKTAFSVGKILKEIAKKDQVLCVSHLPQVAIWADNHMKVSKIVEENRTITVLENLKGERRVKEIARMLGGEEYESAIKHAKELLESTGEKI